MLERLPGWTLDKERERIRNLTASYFGAKQDHEDHTARVRKLQDERANVMMVGVAVALVCLGITWFLSFVVGAFLFWYWRYCTQEIRSTEQAAAQRREMMKQLRELLEQVGLSPHSPWTVEKDGQVLGFVPRYEPEL